MNDIGEEWLIQSSMVHDEQGWLLSTMWAEGPVFRAIAHPASSEASKISLFFRRELLSVVAESVNALSFGMIDEAWRKEFASMDEIENLEHGDLAVLAEIDPTVETSIISTWADLADASIESGLLARHIDDDGEAYWIYEQSNGAFGEMVEVIRDVLGGVAVCRIPDPSDIELEQLWEQVDALAESCGWKVLIWMK